MASARLLQRSAATGRAVGAPVKPADARWGNTDEGDQKEEVTRQQRATGDADSGEGHKAVRRPKGGGDEVAEGRGWRRQ